MFVFVVCMYQFTSCQEHRTNKRIGCMCPLLGRVVETDGPRQSPGSYAWIGVRMIGIVQILCWSERWRFVPTVRNSTKLCWEKITESFPPILFQKKSSLLGQLLANTNNKEIQWVESWVSISEVSRIVKLPIVNIIRLVYRTTSSTHPSSSSFLHVGLSSLPFSHSCPITPHQIYKKGIHERWTPTETGSLSSFNLPSF